MANRADDPKSSVSTYIYHNDEVLSPGKGPSLLPCMRKFEQIVVLPACKMSIGRSLKAKHQSTSVPAGVGDERQMGGWR